MRTRRSTLALLLLARCGAAPPHLITILADDLGWADTALYNPLAPTPRIKEEADQGLLLERHYVFRYCSPSRRAFLSGRFPTSITTVQPDGADTCSDFLPLATTTLAEKLTRGARRPSLPSDSDSSARPLRRPAFLPCRGPS